jgi:hypothetical protein
VPAASAVKHDLDRWRVLDLLEPGELSYRLLAKQAVSIGPARRRLRPGCRSISA